MPSPHWLILGGLPSALSKATSKREEENEWAEKRKGGRET